MQAVLLRLQAVVFHTSGVLRLHPVTDALMCEMPASLTTCAGLILRQFKTGLMLFLDAHPYRDALVCSFERKEKQFLYFLILA